ncbi:hypothetical protein PUN28_003712 [Cardiocondyla obscurior]|uniref:Uncharacterized protein n=1 Tax=Cardiocondyla obscurior TaxID=286306 RepID=A0AAW2GP26_9HYME
MRHILIQIFLTATQHFRQSERIFFINCCFKVFDIYSCIKRGCEKKLVLRDQRARVKMRNMQKMLVYIKKKKIVKFKFITFFMIIMPIVALKITLI